MMAYKNYIAHVEYDDEAEIFHGEVINTRDVITFQGKSVNELKKALADSIEDYLAFCDERGETPDKPFSGKFNLRLDPEIHREAAIAAREGGLSLNQWVAEAITQHLALPLRSP
jgi:predicted HicB family RNase H-like nuclease